MRVVPSALAVVTVVLAACSSSDPKTAADTGREWGGLAVVDGQPSGDEALSSGTLRIEDDCVVLVSGTDESRSLMVWPSDGTTWHPDSRTITYSDGERSIELSDGDAFRVGGGGDNPAEGGRSAVAWAASLDSWAAEPTPSCLSSIDSWWFVGGLPSDRN